MSLDTFNTLQQPNDLVREVIERRGALYDTNMFDFHEAITDFAGRMKEKYGERCQGVRAYHALIDSGIPAGRKGENDFPGEDSVLEFLSQQEKILKSE